MNEWMPIVTDDMVLTEVRMVEREPRPGAILSVDFVYRDAA